MNYTLFALNRLYYLASIVGFPHFYHIAYFQKAEGSVFELVAVLLILTRNECNYAGSSPIITQEDTVKLVLFLLI